MKPSNENISIKRKSFGEKNAKFSLGLTIVIFIFGVILSLFNLKEAICSISIIIVFYFVIKKNIIKLTSIIFVAIILNAIYSYFLNLNFILILTITALLSFFFFIKALHNSIEKNSDFEIFFLDNKKLKCLSTKDNDYKGYALSPTSYIKTYSTTDIKFVEFRKNALLICIGNEIIRPKEITSTELREIKIFIENNFSYLLNDKNVMIENIKLENKFNIIGMLIYSPFIIFPILIYFFADNGRNSNLTFTLLLLMFSLPFLIIKLLKQK